MREYFDVDQERIKDRIAANEPLGLIAREEGVSCSVVLNIRNGKNVPTSWRQVKSKHRNRKVGEEVCTCCGIRPKDNDLRFLCEYCYKYADCGSIDVFEDFPSMDG
jgi:hypothetical protein